MTPTVEHIKGDPKEDEAAGDLKGRQANAEEVEDIPAYQGKQGQDDEGIEAGPGGHLPGRGLRLPRGQGQVGKDITQRV